MATTIRIKKSGTSSNTPANLEFGELAINYADGKLFYRDASNTIQEFTSGGGGNAFETVNANGSLLIADSNTDILNLLAGSGLDISGNTVTDTATLSVRLDNTVTSVETTMAATPAAVNAVHTIATGAYSQANTADSTAQAAYGQANSAYTAANTAQTTAQNAYGQANAAYGQANAAYGQANAAYGQANTALAIANDAYTQANSNYQPAVTRLNVANNGSIAYLFDQYSGDNPTLYVRAGESIAFSLNVSGHPFMIRTSSGGSNYNTGLTHVAANGLVTTGSNAEGKEAGTLYWKVPYDLQGNTYVYQCSIHSGMVGDIVIEQPTVVAYSLANNAYSQANAAYSQANAAYGQANSAYGQANNAYTAANSAANTVAVSQNSGSTLSGKQLNFVNTGTVTIAVTDSGDGNANIEFTSVGGGGGLASFPVSTNSTAVVSAANGLNFVNTATITVAVTSGVDGNANISFTSLGAAANLAILDEGSSLTGSVSSIDFVGAGVTATATGSDVTVTIPGGAGASNTVITREAFTGNGVQTVFSLSVTPEDEAHTLVFVDLVYQRDNAYSINGNDLEFDTAPDNGANVDVYIYGAGGGSAVITPDIFTANGTQSVFTLSQISKTNRTFVFIDGVSQRPDYDFQVQDDILTMNVAPTVNSIVEVRGFSRFNAVELNAAPVTLKSDKFTGNSSCTIFTLSQVGTTDSTFVFINGVAQKPTTDYTVASNTITFSSAPANNSVVEVRSVGNFKLLEPTSKIESDVFSANGVQNAFTLTEATSTRKSLVYIDGVAQVPYTDYRVTGKNLTFVEAPPANTVVEVRTFSPFAVADISKTLVVYTRSGGFVDVPLRIGAPATLTIVGRTANTSVGVS